MATVYVVNFSEQDFSPAEKWGNIQYITRGRGLNVFDIEGLLMICKEALLDSTPEDWLIISGPSILNIVVSSIMLTRHNRVNFLLFDAKARDYEPKTMTTNQTGGMDDL